MYKCTLGVLIFSFFIGLKTSLLFLGFSGYSLITDQLLRARSKLRLRKVNLKPYNK
jgi:hypothetical protein